MVGIHVKCSLFFPILTEVGMCRLYKSPKYGTSAKIYPVGVDLFHPVPQKNDEAKSRFL
jgi:hypothetical protein